MYTIDYERIVSAIREHKPARVLIQLPDGLKARALEIQQRLEKETHVQILFWAGTNYGACDLPVGLEKLGVDLLIHLGHTEWVY
jgi:diphthamide biosynthesis enzyme Dph1/Dph2-like protein